MAERITNRTRVLPAVLALAARCSRWPLPAHGFNKVKIGDKMPAFTLKDTAGADVGLAPGQAHVIVFFKEGPNTANAFKRVGKSWAAMKDKGVVYLGVYFGKGKPEEAKALATEGAGFPILMGTEELYGTLGVVAHAGDRLGRQGRRDDPRGEPDRLRPGADHQRVRAGRPRREEGRGRRARASARRRARRRAPRRRRPRRCTASRWC